MNNSLHNTFIKGKLNLKSKPTRAQIEIKRNIISKINKNNNIYDEFEEIKRNIFNKKIDNSKLTMLNEEKLIVDDEKKKTKAETVFLNKKMNDLNSKIEKEREGVIEKFKNILNKQGDHN